MTGRFIRNSIRWKIICLLAMTMLFMAGCSIKKDSGEKVRDLEFTVAGEGELPQELRSILAEKKAQPFKLSFTDDQNLYIAIGYGPQSTGGYSIQVKELYLTDNSVVIQTELLGPEKGEEAAPEASYPFIVVKTELLENPIIFK